MKSIEYNEILISIIKIRKKPRLQANLKNGVKNLNEKLKEKIKESLASVVPITAIVLLLSFTITPVETHVILLFIIGAVLLTFGMGIFTLGAETSMTVMGERMGASLSKSKNIWFIALISFLVGTIITIAEPDLQVLATQITEVPSLVLILAVVIGVGIFLAVAMLRIVFQIKLSKLLFILYLLIFIVALFVPEDFLPIAFDTGGVTTGPITVPFLIALGIGAASVRGGKESENDSFGLAALCSAGPVLTVMILGLIFKVDNTVYTPTVISTVENSRSLILLFIEELPNYIWEVTKAILPILIFFLLYQVTNLKMPKNELIKIGVGLLYTFVGLVLFLTGVNVGFMPVGKQLGTELMEMTQEWLIFPIVILMGYFIVQAEPAVLVLTRQVNEITDGAIPEKAMKISLSIGNAIAMIIAVLRADLGIPIYYFLIPGYLLAVILMFIVPEIFTSIAFDSGGITSGTMTATFVLPLVIGICEASGRLDANIMQDAFGLVAMVAMVPIIMVQGMGLIYKFKSEKQVQKVEGAEEDDIIEFKRKRIPERGE